MAPLTRNHTFRLTRATVRAFLWKSCAAIIFFSWGTGVYAQDDSADTRRLLLQLRDELHQTRSELADAQRRIEQLNQQMQALRHGSATREPAVQSPVDSYLSPVDVSRKPDPDTDTSAQSAADLSEAEKMLKAQVEEQHQTKVESASRYRVKLSGLILMNAFSNRGAVDKPDLPSRALNSQDKGSVGATFLQSILGLQVFGPEFAGARTSGSISVDFFGGFSQAPFGATAGILRLREATARMDWTNTSLILGQQAPFISPLSPTSYATLAEPAFAWSGNLWVWTPQLVTEHRFHRSDDSFFSISGGLLAPLTEDIPDFNQGSTPGPGERGRRPALAARAAWQSQAFGETLRFGIGGYTSHLQYKFGRNTDSWAVTSFWQIPLGSRLLFSGEAYRGLAVGGLGGGIWQSVVYSGDPEISTTAFRPLNAAGGWTQVKVRLHPKWETNFAVGQDNVLVHDLRWAPTLQGEYMTPVARNRSSFGNVIYRPKSNLVLSAEYRQIWTYGYIGQPNHADQVSVAAGVSF